ncbi:MAG: Fic family protein [Bacteroidetes bacterium]|nr:Fic family protein [Bacteroidota bacterium]
MKLELDALLPMEPKDEERLWKKFRLEWNYNSNHIEGNTLTYSQTELLLISNQAIGDRDFREFEEMKAHNIAIEMVREIAEDVERPLTESFIRILNATILKEPFWKEAETEDGQKTRRLIKIGEYKELPNSVRPQNGEMFHYSSPEETPAKMQDLLNWYRESIDSAMHPLEIAAKFHYKFVRIHPFDDGNGRVARLVMNYVLLKNGYPPVIIKSSDKKNYFLALNKADVGDLDAFVEYIGKELVWSLEKNIAAAKGQSIDEPEDVDKEISLIEQKLKLLENKVRQIKSLETILVLFDNSFKGIFQTFLTSCKKFDKFYKDSSVHSTISGRGKEVEKSENLMEKFRDEMVQNEQSLQDIGVSYHFKMFNGKGVEYFSYSSSIRIIFSKNYYELKTEQNPEPQRRYYHQFFTKDEIENIILSETKAHTDFINQQIESAQTKPE